MKSLMLKISVLLLFLPSCTETIQAQFPTPDASFDQYWNQGKAEISSYQLEQARYGEIHKGTAVLIFVSEPFSTSEFVKADYPGMDNVQVLKLNATKQFTTGIYPYSMMTSSFFPLDGSTNSLKISCSSQEWCGHTYMEMTRKK